MKAEPLRIRVRVECKLSFWDAVKLRLAGRKADENFEKLYRTLEEKTASNLERKVDDFARGGLVGEHIDPATGCGLGEMYAYDTLEEVVGAFQKLQVQHPDDLNEAFDAIHVLQGLLATRIARRLYPKGWPCK